MSTHDLIVRPSNVQMTLVGNTGLFPSPLIASAQSVDRGGLKWKTVLNYLNLRSANRAEMMALVAQLRAQANRVRVEVSDNPARGAYGGTPLVNGAGQEGNLILVDGLSFSVTNWIRRGDYFSIDVNGEHELKICTADANAVSNATSIAFEPRLRASPADNAAIYVQDGVLPRPQGVFRFDSAENGWSSRPGAPSKITNMTLALTEDVFATQ